MSTPGRSARIALLDWLATREPAPPAALAERLATLLRDDACDDPSGIAELLVSRAAALLSTVGEERTSAADLLAADAMITYAMEAAAEACTDLELRADEAMRRIAGA